jgi:hypothetical protein
MPFMLYVLQAATPLTNRLACGPHLIFLVISISFLNFQRLPDPGLTSSKNHDCGPILEASVDDGVRGGIGVIPSLS